MAIYDAMKFLSCEIITIALRKSFSIASLLLAVGDKGKRYAFKNSEICVFFNLSGNENAIDQLLDDSSNRIE